MTSKSSSASSTDDEAATTTSTRTLSNANAATGQRILAKNGASPPAVDEIPGEFIIKPWVGNAAVDVWETAAQTSLVLGDAQSSSKEAIYNTFQDGEIFPVAAWSSSTENNQYGPYKALDGSAGTRWSSCGGCESTHWLDADLGNEYDLREIFINWETAHAVDYRIQVSNDRNSWTDAYIENGKTNNWDTTIDLSNVAEAKGIRYVRIYTTKRHPSYSNVSIHYFKVYGTRVPEFSHYLDASGVIGSSTSTRWSSESSPSGDEWVDLDMGGPQQLKTINIGWESAHAVDFQIQVSSDRSSWSTIYTENGKGSNSDTTVSVGEIEAAQSARYLRVYMTQRKSGYNNFSIKYVRAYRKPMVTDSNPTGLFCGATITDVATYLLGNYGGTLIYLYENAEFFSASLTEEQKDAMFADNCVFTVEPNFKVRARGTTTGEHRRLGSSAHDQEQRRLAIPEFNLKEVPASELDCYFIAISILLPLSLLVISYSNLLLLKTCTCNSSFDSDWGLERISSRGARNGAYMWLHEGAFTHIYIFDTGIYPDHSDWYGRDGNRYGDGLICTGGADDYTSTDHGTHV